MIPRLSTHPRGGTVLPSHKSARVAFGNPPHKPCVPRPSGLVRGACS
jgi:hypothetical protein